MRLIDADKLKHVIHCAYSDDLEILEKIDEQPTAFDVDKISKEIPKKPIIYPGTNRADCPVCMKTVRGIGKPFGKYCAGCGQRLKWEAED